MDTRIEQQASNAVAAVPPKPGAAPPAEKDQIDPRSADAHAAAPSEGSGLAGNVEPVHKQQRARRPRARRSH